MEDILSDLSPPENLPPHEEVLTEVLAETAQLPIVATILAIPEEIELDEFEEELIIEDFTIDGICGVY